MNSVTLLETFFSYIVHPSYIDENKQGFSQSKDMLQLLVWLYGVVLLLIILDIFFPILSNAAEKNQVTTFITKNSVSTVFLFALLIGPFLEECVFRLSLRSNPIFHLISVFIVGAVFISSPIALFGVHVNSIILTVVICFIVSPFLYIWRNNIRDFYKKYFFLIFYISILSFGLIHLTNYSDVGFSFYLPLLVLPQLIAGLVITYIRMHYGFWYGYMTHVLYNAVLVMISIFSSQHAFLFIVLLFVLIALYGVLSLCITVVKILIQKKGL